MRELRALTLWQPWAWAIVEGHKDIENRPWAPGAALRVGDPFLIHAGMKYDDPDVHNAWGMGL